MSESTITSKGQTTVPAEVRKSIGAASGTRLVWHVMPDGGLLVRVKNKSILHFGRCVEGWKRQTRNR